MGAVYRFRAGRRFAFAAGLARPGEAARAVAALAAAANSGRSLASFLPSGIRPAKPSNTLEAEMAPTSPAARAMARAAAGAAV